MSGTSFDKIQAKILAAIQEQAVLPWCKPWNADAMPTNMATGAAYKGANPYLLNMQSGEALFLGFNQGIKAGARLRPNSKGTAVYGIRYRPAARYETTDKTTGEKVERWQRAAFGTFHVFPLSRWESLGKLEGKFQAQSATIQNRSANAIWEGYSMRPTLGHGNSAAYYAPMTDHIELPSLDSFDNEDSYHATKFHEMGHSTGHKNRLARELTPQNMGGDSYSQEELVAEITSAYLCSVAGITHTQRNSVAYLQHWYSKLKTSGVGILIAAASRADKAAHHILGQ